MDTDWNDVVDKSTASTPSNNGLVTTRLSAISPEPLLPIFGNRILLGKLTALAGDAGVGKSYITHALAAPITRGRPLIGDEQPIGPADVLFASYEDEAADTILPRLQTMKANLGRVHFVEGTNTKNGLKPFSANDIDSLHLKLRDNPQIKFIVIDPVSAWVGSGTDEYRQNEVRSILERLRTLAASHNVAVLLVTHLRKASADKALDKFQGSGAYVQLVRSALLAANDPDNDDQCLLAHVKHNLTKQAPTLCYRIDDSGYFRWEGTKDIDQNRLAGSEQEEEHTQRDEAKDFLKQLLADGPMPAKEVRKEAEQVGIKEATLKRAKKALNIDSNRSGFGSSGVWLWELPD